jgi:hypothetical protein
MGFAATAKKESESMTETMVGTNVISASNAEASRRRVVEDLRSANNFLCLWRVCGNAVCRRARCCRGRAHLCSKRNDAAAPPAVRDFFRSFLAAKYVGVSFDDFRDPMEGREETEAFFAWRQAWAARQR